MKTNWSREETIVALNYYCKIPFGSIHTRNPEIGKIANLLGRTPASIVMKLGNFGSFDPELKKRGVKGLINASKLDKEIWDEFNNNWEELAYKSELLISNLLGKSLDAIESPAVKDLPIGRERESLVKTRVNQNFFRSTILASYHNRCCITGLNIPKLLVASHIIPWSKSEKDRMDPRNGLCLNALHDKAFDKGLITITPEFKILVSSHLLDIKPEDIFEKFFHDLNGGKMILPDRFVPHREFLEYHNKEIFIQ
jgi:putative restriction endonuclease